MGSRGKCPICDNQCDCHNTLTHHHIYYPKRDYELNTLVNICDRCHRDFNLQYKFINPPEAWECLMNFMRFCKSKDKNALIIYPELLSVWRT